MLLARIGRCRGLNLAIKIHNEFQLCMSGPSLCHSRNRIRISFSAYQKRDRVRLGRNQLNCESGT